MLSLTEENYLKAIYKLTAKQEGDENISNTLLSEAMCVKASSVTDMLRRLAEKQLITYKRYQGVRLTAEGQSVALRIIRRHRLWEVFLVEKLHFAWDQVHDIAEQLEHVQSDTLVDRLDEFIGFPKFDPHGDPIPDKDGKLNHRKTRPLSEVQVGKSAKMCGVSDHSDTFLHMLQKIGLGLNNDIYVLAREEYDASLLLVVNDCQPFYISHRVAENVLVEA